MTNLEPMINRKDDPMTDKPDEPADDLAAQLEASRYCVECVVSGGPMDGQNAVLPSTGDMTAFACTFAFEDGSQHGYRLELIDGRNVLRYLGLVGQPKPPTNEREV